jgi:peroxiredoxin Q/BCP
MAKIEVGQKAPSFTLENASGKKVKLSELLSEEFLVLYFYPAAMTPGCTKQACDFRDNLSALAKAGYRVVGISPDTPEKLAKFIEHDELNFELLSDPTREVLEKYGAWGEKQLYGKTVTGVIRSTVVLDAKGKVVQAFHNVKATGHVAKLMRDLGI